MDVEDEDDDDDAAAALKAAMAMSMDVETVGLLVHIKSGDIIARMHRVYVKYLPTDPGICEHPCRPRRRFGRSGTA